MRNRDDLTPDEVSHLQGLATLGVVACDVDGDVADDGGGPVHRHRLERTGGPGAEGERSPRPIFINFTGHT